MQPIVGNFHAGAPVRLNKIIVLVSEVCNLRCRYCYIECARRSRGELMSACAAAELARRVFADGGSCNYVQFFGGEPALNIPAISAFVDEVSRLIEKRTLSAPPQFGIVTNGASRHSPAMIDYCRQHGIAVTVSIDGPKPIHDALRVTAHGTGTFDRAIATVEAALRLGLPVAIETVYTSAHMDCGLTIVDLLEFVEALGVKKLIFHMAYPPAPLELCPFDDGHFDQLVRQHVDAVDWWFGSLLNGRLKLTDVYFRDLLVPLLEGGGAGVAGGGCPAGTRDLAIGPGGDVYSCHLLYGMPGFRLGNLLTHDFGLREETNLPRHTGDIPDCAGCFARFWCQPCGALNLSWGDAWTTPARECDLRRAVLLRLAELALRHLVVPPNAMTDLLAQSLAHGQPCPVGTLPTLGAPVSSG